ncbi:MAG: hypothetical protein GTO24_11480, partial [candidate division Zixibacteria bacterium]|nr:hypothetical protein [candidate division Zixibacteria bacterium]
MRKLFSLVFLFILLFCFLSFASAQVPEKLRINMDLARELMRVGQPAEAVKIISQLIDVYGETRELRELL